MDEDKNRIPQVDAWCRPASNPLLLLIFNFPPLNRRPTSAGQVVASKTPSTQTASAMYKVLEVDRRDGLSEISSTNKKRISGGSPARRDCRL